MEQKLTSVLPKKEVIISENNEFYKQLSYLMQEKKIYRNASLSLTYVSEMLNVSSNYLSILINKISGYSYTDYVNGHRVEDIKKKLKDKSYSNYSTLSIGLESGFNSKSVFYVSFKKHVGMTPTQYRKQNYCT